MTVSYFCWINRVDYYHYDKDIDFNDLGYLWRNDYTQTKSGFKVQSLEPWNIIRNASIILEGDMEENTDKLDLGKTIELIYDLEFDNFWGIGGGLYKIIEHYDDRKIIVDFEQNEFGPPIFIPEVTGSHFNISTDKHRKLWGTLSLTWASNTRNDTERGQYVELNYKPSPHLSFSTSYDRYRLIKQYHWLETFHEPATVDTHYIFSDLNRKMDILAFRAIGNINRELSLQGYLELFSNYDIFAKDSYSEFLSSSKTFSNSTDYILGQGNWIGKPVYTDDEKKLNSSYLDPNVYLGLYPQFTSIIINGIVKWNYMRGSNIYFVYSFNKSVNGTSFIGFEGLGDFLQFNNKRRWIEVLRDQTIMIKIDYWFEK